MNIIISSITELILPLSDIIVDYMNNNFYLDYNFGELKYQHDVFDDPLTHTEALIQRTDDSYIYSLKPIINDCGIYTSLSGDIILMVDHTNLNLKIKYPCIGITLAELQIIRRTKIYGNFHLNRYIDDKTDIRLYNNDTNQLIYDFKLKCFIPKLSAMIDIKIYKTTQLLLRLLSFYNIQV